MERGVNTLAMQYAGYAADISHIVDAKTFRRPMWAGNLIQTVQVDG